MQEKQRNMGFSLHAKCTIKILEIIDECKLSLPAKLILGVDIMLTLC
jgi:hypothetical protein